MTRDEIMALEGRELDAAIAERVCGWRWVKSMHATPGRILRSAEQASQWKDYATGSEVLYDGWDGGVRRYSTDLNACREAEAFFHGTGGDADGAREMRLLRWHRAIREMLSPISALSPYHEWAVANADAPTRCRAMLLALALEEGR